MTKQLYDVGDAPPVGVVPPKMHAWLVRQDRFGEPVEAWRQEVIDTPSIGDDEVLVYVMAAGINYNNVWAGLGVPVDVIGARQKAGEAEDFHVGGSDASGIVYRVGKNVTHVEVGDEVVVHCGSWDVNAPDVVAGGDPMFDPSFRIWGYETNYGSFAQFTRVEGHQCLPRPQHLSWEASAAYMLVGATAYRMLLGWKERSLKAGDVALIWGGAGGLGSMAIQIARAVGADPVAVVSSDEKRPYCEALGARGVINRRNFDHWGMLPHWKDRAGYSEWLKGVRSFGKAIWEELGEKRNPRIVFEHPGENTIPTSMFVCETGGMVVICAGTTGYNATVDLRYLWMRQKRLQGSHFANDVQAKGLNDLVLEGKVDPCLSRAFRHAELPDAHQLMYKNRHPHGNMSVLIGAPEFGLGVHAAGPRAVRVDAVDEPSEPEVVYVPPREAPPGPGELPVVFEDDTRVAAILHPGVITCAPQATVEEVARLLVAYRIHAVVVIDEDERAAGVISQTDVVLARQGRSAEELGQLRADEIMTPSLIHCEADTRVSEAVTTMTRRGIHRLIVTEERDGRPFPIGVVSMTDIIHKMVATPAGGGDGRIAG
jgi:crotonyl-CoA carboxylase/reductase